MTATEIDKRDKKIEELEEEIILKEKVKDYNKLLKIDLTEDKRHKIEGQLIQTKGILKMLGDD